MRNSPPIPAWGRWIICIFLGVILGLAIVSSGVIPGILHLAGQAIGGLFTILLTPILLVLSVALYLLPSIIATRSPRLTAIAVANLVFGWTIVGWFIVLIWALAESGSLNKKPTT